MEIYEAYLKPLTENSTKKFSWSRIDFNSLDKFLQEKLGLSRQQVTQVQLFTSSKNNIRETDDLWCIPTLG